jgi:alkylhydroperoxidase/carboxymuconolactone decarboxylase family protein YurZ
MLVLYAGYPAALEALRLLQETWPGAVRGTSEGGRSRWRARGEQLCRKVYGPVYPRLLEAVRGLHPDLAAWMVEEGYGRVLSRPRLGARARELVTVAVLAATGWRRQLVSHLKGAGRVGGGLAARAAGRAPRGHGGLARIPAGFARPPRVFRLTPSGRLPKIARR